MVDLRKRRLLLVIILIYIFFILGCSSSQKNDKLTVNIAYFANITHSQALVGKTEGQFKKSFGSKANVNWIQFNGGSTEVEALLAGAVDIGYIGPGPAISGFIKSKGGLQIVAGATDGGAILVSRKGLKIKNLKELSGKRIAVPQFGNTQDLTLRTILQENGLKDTTKGGTVDILQAENPDIKTYLDRGYIDAAFVPEPWGSRLIKEVDANLVVEYNQVMRNGKYPTAVVIVRKEFLKAHPEIVKEFLKTHVDLTGYIKKNLQKEKKVVNTQLKELTGKKLKDDILDNAFKRLIITYDPEAASIDEFNESIVKAGYLKEKPDTTGILNLDILNEVLKEKGLPEVK